MRTPNNLVDLSELFDLVVLPKKGKMSAKDKERQNGKEYKKIRKWHSGVESAIGALVAGNGLGTCRDKGQDGYTRYLAMAMETNDVMSSQGVRLNDDPLADDPIFNWNTNRRATRDTTFAQRKVEPRNKPSMINAVFHLDMFWDGRASFIFNGVNPFGFRDREATAQRFIDGVIEDVFVRIPFAAHASQSVGPPLSTLEMTGIIRDFPELADKLLLADDPEPALNPLALQMVHPQDSVLGPYAKASYVLNRQGKPTGRIDNIPGTKNPLTGEDLTYLELIQDAFKEEWWNGGDEQIMHNFSLFFGLAMQLY